MGAEFIFCSLCFGLDFQTKRQNQGPNLCYPLGLMALHAEIIFTLIFSSYVVKIEPLFFSPHIKLVISTL